MCAPLRVHGYTSCRQGPHVVLNLARFLTSVSGYRKADVPLDTYRTYMINHEVGHALGHGHELCPGPGKPAPGDGATDVRPARMSGEPVAVRERQSATTGHPAGTDFGTIASAHEAAPAPTWHAVRDGPFEAPGTAP